MTAIVKNKLSKVKEPNCLSFATAFERNLISSATLEFTKQKGFTLLSPVQYAVIPLALQQHKDFLIEACTGSGKTLAFLIPVVEVLFKNVQNKKYPKIYSCCVGALLLAPTRELATQIQTVLDEYLHFVNRRSSNNSREHPLMSSLLFVGGSNLEKDIDIFRRRNTPWECYTVLVATPGRLCALLEHLELNKDWHFSNLEILVFDEADRLLMERASFETQLACILKIVPKQRRTFLVSATLSNELITLLKAGIKNPLLVRVEATKGNSLQIPQQPQTSQPVASSDTLDISKQSFSSEHHILPECLANFYCIIQRHSKFAFLLKFLLCHILPINKLKQENASLHSMTLLRLYGKMSQKSRNVATQRFHNAAERDACILFATDVAARGLDFPNVSWIIQYDPPTDPIMFVHRVGRAARAGNEGRSLLFLCPSEESYVAFLRNRQVALEELQHQHHLIQQLDAIHLKRVLKIIEVPDIFMEAMNEFKLNFPNLQREEYSTFLTISPDDLKFSWNICRAILLSDQDMIRSAAEAVVSFIRAYKENHLQYIFVFKDLEIGELASSLGLLRLPRVKEILAKSIKGFHQSCVDPKKIPFKDPLKEESFRKRVESAQKKLSNSNPLIVKKAPPLKKRTKNEQRRAQKRRILEEIEELRRDENLFKKLKKRKISLSKYNRLLQKDIS